MSIHCNEKTSLALLGLYLTCADSGRKDISFVGPVGIDSFWQSTGGFTHRTMVTTNIIEMTTYQSMDVGTFIVHCLPLLSSPQNQPSHISYVIETKVLPGKFDVAKALSLGVPKGPLFGSLQRGESITLPDGTEVTPQDVLRPAGPPRYAAIVCDVGAPSRGSGDTSSSLCEALVAHPFWTR